MFFVQYQVISCQLWRSLLYTLAEVRLPAARYSCCILGFTCSSCMGERQRNGTVIGIATKFVHE